MAPQVFIEKRRGEGLGVALVESGWGSLLPTAVIANLLHGGPAERSGALSIGDRITAINGTSLVGLPLAACQAAVRVSAPGPARAKASSGPGMSPFSPLNLPPSQMAALPQPLLPALWHPLGSFMHKIPAPVVFSHSLSNSLCKASWTKVVLSIH